MPNVAVLLPPELAAGEYQGIHLTPSSRLVLGHLLAHADETGLAAVSKDQIARDLGMSLRLVRQLLGLMISLGLVEVAKVDNRLRTGASGAHLTARNTYRLPPEFFTAAVSTTGEHDWPAELDSDACCTRCGLEYDQWSIGDACDG